MGKKIWMGIDPGYASGAVCMLDESGHVDFIEVTNKWKNVANELRGISYSDIFCVLEEVHAISKQGIKGAFTFGSGFGALWFWLLYENIDHVRVSPQEWQNNIVAGFGGSAKERTKAYVLKKYPKVFPSGKKFNHNFADALCIAEYARKMEQVRAYREELR